MTCAQGVSRLACSLPDRLETAVTDGDSTHSHKERSVNPTEKVDSAGLPPDLAFFGPWRAQRTLDAAGGRRRMTYPQESRPRGSCSREGWLCRAVRAALAIPRQDVGKRNPVKLAIDHTPSQESL